MKGKSYLLLGLVVGIVLGWAMGFLRLPHLEKNSSFWLGFIAALAFVSLALMLLAAWNGNVLPGLIVKKRVPGAAKSSRTPTFLWIVLVGILVLGGVVAGSTVYRRNEAFKLQVQDLHQQRQELVALLAAVKLAAAQPLLRSILEDVADELKRHPGRMLGDSTIARIAALSFSFQPYPNVEGDSLSEQASSPERGQLLQALLLLNMDTGSFARIKRHTLFAGAALRGTNLKGLDLSGIQLEDANLKDADLSGANLQGADLGGANLWGAKLTRANLSRTNLKRADLRWAQLNEATLTLANLNGANLTNAQLIKAEVFDATFQWAQADGALFNEANLISVDFVGAQLNRVNLTQANLSDADLRKINLREADLVDVRLSKALVDKNWLDKLKEWQPTGMKAIQDNYTVVNDTVNQWKDPLYRLREN